MPRNDWVEVDDGTDDGTGDYSSQTLRRRVVGGWLYRTRTFFFAGDEDEGYMGVSVSEAMEFVPAPNTNPHEEDPDA